MFFYFALSLICDGFYELGVGGGFLEEVDDLFGYVAAGQVG